MARFPTGVVIVGGSAAGPSAADGLREGGYAGSITVLDENIEPGFDRPMLSKSLLASDDGRPLRLRTDQRLSEQGVTMLPGHRAMGLDIDRRLVVTSYGEAIPFEQVVIAGGVDARRLATTSGERLPVLRNFSDLETLRAMVSAHRSLTIIGGGYIGLEVAAALRPKGVGLTVIAPDELPLVKVLGPDVATWLRDLHLAHGVHLRLGTRVDAVRVPSDGGYILDLGDGTSAEAECVLAGVGTAANTDWLIGSGVALDDGVLTDVAGRTNAPGIWAAGDIATTFDPSTGVHRRFHHWTNAIEQGRRVGLNIARGEALAVESARYVWTEQFGTTLHQVGERRPDDTDMVVRGSFEASEFIVLHGRGDELHAVTLCGFPTAVRTYKKLLRAPASVTDAVAQAPA